MKINNACPLFTMNMTLTADDLNDHKPIAMAATHLQSANAVNFYGHSDAATRSIP